MGELHLDIYSYINSNLPFYNPMKFERKHCRGPSFNFGAAAATAAAISAETGETIISGMGELHLHIYPNTNSGPPSHTPMKLKRKHCRGLDFNFGAAAAAATAAAISAETGETIISGMGELHLDIYVERMKREYKVECDVGRPKVNYREAIMCKGEFNYLHKKQSGGSGQYGRVIGYIEPLAEGDEGKFEYENELVGNAIPPEFHQAIEKGFKEAANAGALIGAPVEVRGDWYLENMFTIIITTSISLLKTLSVEVSGGG